MIPLLNILMVIQAVTTVLAVLFNNFLIVIILKYSQQKYGFYKYLMIMFAAFEELYAILVLIAMPLHLIADKSWLTFTYFGLLSMTPYSVLGPMLYCSFYQIWVVIVVVHFIYRYIVVCKPFLADTIGNSRKIKSVLVTLFLLVVSYCFFCGMYYCTRNKYSKHLESRLINEFNITDPEKIGASMLRLTDDEGNWSFSGIMATGNHYFLVFTSTIIIIYCGFNIWATISRMRRDICKMKEAKMQGQMFLSLVVQTSVPVLFCHLPTLIGLSFPLLENLSFGPFSPVFTCLTSVNKVIDPLILMYFIADYRTAVVKLMTKTVRLDNNTSISKPSTAIHTLNT